MMTQAEQREMNEWYYDMTKKSMIHCEHANECPYRCNCPENCACRTNGICYSFRARMAEMSDAEPTLVTARRCSNHPAYDADEQPTTTCAACWQLYFGISDTCVNCGCQQNECEDDD